MTGIVQQNSDSTIAIILYILFHNELPVEKVNARKDHSPVLVKSFTIHVSREIMQLLGWVWFHLSFPSVYEKTEYPLFQVLYLDVVNLYMTTYSYFNSPNIVLKSSTL
jgi:hypothetical protein